MRSFQVLMFMLCVLAGLYLLIYAPEFFLPERGDPSFGRRFDATSARLLGAGLLAIAWAGGIYLHRFYYSAVRRLPEPRAQRRYFAIALLALVLVTAAFNLATPGPNPEYRPPASGH